MKLWVTRPIEDAKATAQQLRARGHDVLQVPLLQIVSLPLPALKTDGLDGIIITSRNGARRLLELTDERDMPLYAVGEATAHLLWTAGFQKILTASGNLSGLEDLFRQKLPQRPSSDRGRLLHLCGRQRAGDPTSVLNELGYDLERLEAYDSQSLKELPDSVRTSIVKEQLDGVLFYSPRTARAFLSLLEKSDFDFNCRKIVAFCLSDKIAEAVRSLPWKEMITAERPKQSHLLKAIDQQSGLS